MGAITRVGATLLTAVLTSAALLPVLGGGWAELTFGTFLVGGLLIVLQLAVDGWRSSRREAERARVLARTSPAALARRAVAEERRRLEADLAATIHEALVGIADVARAADGPRAARRIQHDARAATSELRRQLGLLRTAPVAESPDSSIAEAAPRTRPSGGEMILAAAAALLASFEVFVFAAGEDYPTASIPATALLTAATAATVAWRRAAPVPAAVACTALITAGSLAGTPVTEGLWLPVTIGSLLWTLAAHSRLLGAGGAAALVLVGTSLVTRWLHTPFNLGVVTLVESVALAGGLTVRLLARRRSRAAARAGLRAAELQQAVDVAVSAERVTIARDLHDVVSHAVGLVAVQAAAAEVTWRTDEVAARRALDLVRSTAEETLAEIDRLLPGGASSSKGVGDLESLAARIRSAGSTVRLHVSGANETADLRVVYRVVQEALTNVVRHAPGATAEVRVACTSTTAEVTVVDDGPGLSGGVQRGYGLVGLAERVELAGGRLATGPGPGGLGFQVAATLPARQAPPAGVDRRVVEVE